MCEEAKDDEGECGVIPETLQTGGEGVMKWLVMLFNMVW